MISYPLALELLPGVREFNSIRRRSEILRRALQSPRHIVNRYFHVSNLGVIVGHLREHLFSTLLQFVQPAHQCLILRVCDFFGIRDFDFSFGRGLQLFGSLAV